MEPAPTTEVVTPSPLPVETAPAEVDSGNGRPASITLELSGTTTQADGSYTSSGVARLCGNAVMNLTGNVREFSFEFPNDSDDHQIGDVTFSAQDLLPGATTTSFHIGVSVTTADGHEPPATVVDTEQAGSDDTGSAQRSEIRRDDDPDPRRLRRDRPDHPPDRHLRAKGRVVFRQGGSSDGPGTHRPHRRPLEPPPRHVQRRDRHARRRGLRRGSPALERRPRPAAGRRGPPDDDRRGRDRHPVRARSRLRARGPSRGPQRPRSFELQRRPCP